jgi:hypothetical protein
MDIFWKYDADYFLCYRILLILLEVKGHPKPIQLVPG